MCKHWRKLESIKTGDMAPGCREHRAVRFPRRNIKPPCSLCSRGTFRLWKGFFLTIPFSQATGKESLQFCPGSDDRGRHSAGPGTSLLICSADSGAGSSLQPPLPGLPFTVFPHVASQLLQPRLPDTDPQTPRIYTGETWSVLSALTICTETRNRIENWM